MLGGLPQEYDLQWGYVIGLTSVQSPVTFPISHSKIYGIAAVCAYEGTASSGVSRGHSVKNLTTSGFTFCYPDASSKFGVSYLCIGEQQWGCSVTADFYNNAIYTALNISYSSTNYCVMTQPLGTNDYSAWYSHSAIEVREKSRFMFRSFGNMESTLLWFTCGY